MLKRELADAAGVSMRTLHRWCQPYREELTSMGVKPNDKLLSPKVARFNIVPLYSRTLFFIHSMYMFTSANSNLPLIEGLG